MSWSAPDEWSRWDPERLLVCPYDEAHLIKTKRFQRHLLKCRKNHADKDFVSCPFNAKHIMLRSEIRRHVSRCPDRSVIEHYNYKGSEKDKDGFYFKGNTSVPSYHKSEELQNPSESWDGDVEDENLQWTKSSVNVPPHIQRLPQSAAVVTDTLSLSPEERERFKRQMRREAALSRGADSGMLLPSERLSVRQEYNGNSDIGDANLSQSVNPAFRHYTERGSVPNYAVQDAQDSTRKDVFPLRSLSKQRNPIFEYCIGKMQNVPEDAKNQQFTSSNELNKMQCETSEKRVQPCGEKENISSPQNFSESSSNYSTNTVSMDLRAGYTENKMARLTLDSRTSEPEVVYCAPGQPTTPGSARAMGTDLAGVGRARLLAEARRNNFGGICFSPPKVAGSDTARKTPSFGRGRGVLNYFMQSP